LNGDVHGTDLSGVWSRRSGTRQEHHGGPSYSSGAFFLIEASAWASEPSGSAMGIGFVAVVLGFTAFFTGWAWGLRIAYRENTVKGMACTLVPLLMIYFLSNNPRRGWLPLFLFLGGLVAIMWGY
jgi:hypothetical protein